MEQLAAYRARIDILDDAIVDLLVERTDIVTEVAALKAQQNIPAILQDRIDEVRERCAERGAAKGVDPEFIRRLYTLIIAQACDLEEEIIGKS